MNGINTRRLIFGLAVCLSASACRTCREEVASAEPVLAGKPAPLASGTASDVLQKMKAITLPEVTFRPPATIDDAVHFFKQASRDYDSPETPADRRGVEFSLRLPGAPTPDPFACETNAVPAICALSARSISLYDAVKLVCDVTGMKMRVSREGSVLIVPDCGEEGELVTRSFDLPAPLCGVCGKLHDGHAGQAECAAQSADWKSWLESMGVTWPAGSDATLLAAAGKLRVTNLTKNLVLIEDLFRDLVAVPRQISVEVEVIAVRLRDVDKLAAEGGMSPEALTALRRRGKARLVSVASVTAKSGQEAVAKAVQEVIYPAELSGGDAGRSNGVAAVAGTVLPSRFAAREVGVILQVVPSVVAGGERIDLMLSAQWLTLKEWEAYHAARAGRWRASAVPLRQPLFEVTSFQTQVSVKNGGTVLLGGISTPDNEWVHYGLLTAKRVEVEPGLSGR